MAAQHAELDGVSSKIVLLSMIVSVLVNAPTRTRTRSLSQDCCRGPGHRGVSTVTRTDRWVCGGSEIGPDR